MRMHHIAICSVVRLYHMYLYYLINDMIFGKKVIGYENCF